MIKYVALYRTPTDPAAFDRDYFGSHVPIVNDTPGLVRTELAKVTRMLTGEPAYYLVAELYFESPESMTAAFKSDPWRASGAVSYTHLRAHETVLDLVCRLLL